MICREETINLIHLILHYFDIIYKTVKPSHLEKLQIMQDVNKLMFQVTFIFSYWILIDQIIASLTPSVLWEADFQKILPRVLSGGTGPWVKMHKFNAFSGNVNTINWKFFPTHGGMYKLEKIQQAFWREINPKEFKEIWKDASLRLILKDKGGKQYCLPICYF